ncbi:Cyclin-D-4 [Tetrabaena socialis]|uniref:Cyclin-D-4 n=1 Tax=Tetrabaena socialis TaxID=47790 RepID=A0A2J7ZX15_9CHLO|nr:Cyclin-D-4 [Tetrabaena socialis]|eukprot:PNH04814.1 Cyclin-D-4 [Tetrabaena socialis]
MWCGPDPSDDDCAEADDCAETDDCCSQLASSLQSSLTSSSLTSLGCTEKVAFDDYTGEDALDELLRDLLHREDRSQAAIGSPQLSAANENEPHPASACHRDGLRCRDTRDKLPFALYSTGPLDSAAAQELLWTELNQQSELYGKHRTAAAPVVQPLLQAGRLQPFSVSANTLTKGLTCGGFSCSGAASAGRSPTGWPATGARDRGLLVGWMTQLAHAAGLQRETLFAATSLLDRFVMRAEDYPHERVLQLLAMACMSVAMKFEEVSPLPNAHLLALAVDPETGLQMYQVADLARMEWLLLRSIDWRVRAPNALTFLQRFLHCCGVVCAGPDDNAGPEAGAGGAASAAACPCCRAWSSCLAKTAEQLSEASLLYDALLPYDQSTVAMACVLLAERVADSGAAASSFPPAAGVSWVAGRVCDFARMPLDALAPGLASCVAQLEMLWAGAAAPQAAPYHQQAPQQVERRAHHVRQQQYGSYHYAPY